MATQQGGCEIGNDYAPTLTSASGTSGNNQPVIMSFGWNKSAAQSMNVNEHTVDPLKAARCAEPAVAICGVETGPGFWREDQISGTVKVNGAEPTTAVLCDTIIRRLTPLECERLMGFPDFHTLIPWGVPKRIDFARQMGKISPAGNYDYRDDYHYLRGHGFDHQAAAMLAFCPDGPRYKACGNGWAVNAIRWIGMRIDIVDKINNNQRGNYDGEGKESV